MKRAWLELFDWEFVTATNAALCQPKKALHKPTSDGYDPARQLWEESYRREMFLDEAADLCEANFAPLRDISHTLKLIGQLIAAGGRA